MASDIVSKAQVPWGRIDSPRSNISVVSCSIRVFLSWIGALLKSLDRGGIRRSVSVGSPPNTSTSARGCRVLDGGCLLEAMEVVVLYRSALR